MMNTTLNSNFLRALNAEIEAAVMAVAAKHGVRIKAGNCRFTSHSATLKLEIATVSADGEVVDKHLIALRSNARWLGLDDGHLAKQFVLGGKTFVLAGYNSRRYAKPFILKCLDNGKKYVARQGDVFYALGITTKAL